MNRISKYYPPARPPTTPESLRGGLSRLDRLERRETAPENAQSLLAIFAAMTLYVAGGISAVWLVTYVIAHAVRFVWGS